jgi:hypothetical protein
MPIPSASLKPNLNTTANVRQRRRANGAPTANAQTSVANSVALPPPSRRKAKAQPTVSVANPMYARTQLHSPKITTSPATSPQNANAQPPVSVAHPNPQPLADPLMDAGDFEAKMGIKKRGEDAMDTAVQVGETSAGITASVTATDGLGLDNLDGDDGLTGDFEGGTGILGGVLGMGLGMKGMVGDFKRRSAAGEMKDGKMKDAAGVSIANDGIKENGLKVLKGAVSTSTASVKLAGSHIATFAEAGKAVATGLGAATGALTVAEGLYKGGFDAMHLHKTRTFKPLSAKGNIWRSHIVKKKGIKVGINALKVIGGGLGIAGSVLTGGVLPLALGAVGAGIGVGMGLAKFGRSMNKQRKIRKARKADTTITSKEMTPENVSKAQELNKKHSTTGGFVSEMIAAVRNASKPTMEKMQKLHIASQKGPSVQDKIMNFFKSLTKDGVANENKQNIIDAENAQKDAKLELDTMGSDFESYDAHELLAAIGVKKEEAESKSGQELIEKKISVTNSL